MSAEPSGPRRIAVLDVGKTNVKVVLFDGADGREVWVRTLPNPARQDGPYPHFDTARIEAFFVDALAELAGTDGGFDALSISGHGAAGALLGPGGLALPILDYEHEGLAATADAYDRVRPGFDETFSPRLPGGLNLGAQLFWQQSTFPDAFAAATAFVTYPQYWAFWLTGVAATEATSLGCHTDLWAPRAGGFSSLVDAMGWSALMAPVRSAFDVLGPVRPELARRIGLRHPVPVACGIHDSNASLLPHLQAEAGAFSVMSTGTWAIAFAVGGALDRLDPARDTLANVDAFGRAVPSARFMGGREFGILAGEASSPPDRETVDRVIARQIMALPTFAPGNGPYPKARGRWSHDPATLTGAERTAAASLYQALMAAACLDLLAAGGHTIVEGPFARNDLFRDALARLTKRPVLPSPGATGTSAGAARLALTHAPPPKPPAPAAATFALTEEFDLYAARWRAECETA